MESSRSRETEIDSFETLVTEAWTKEFSGWDFSFLRGRMVETKPSWSFRALSEAKLEGIESLLDIDTGGGEFLASLQSLPPIACATPA